MQLARQQQHHHHRAAGRAATARRTVAAAPLRRGVAASSTGASTSSSIVVRAPTDEERKQASRWPTWGCGAETFPWTYDEKETCLILEGEVVVTPKDQQKFGPAMTAKAGDWAVFPAGMSCTWAVSKPIKKHYRFG